MAALALEVLYSMFEIRSRRRATAAAVKKEVGGSGKDGEIWFQVLSS